MGVLFSHLSHTSDKKHNSETTVWRISLVAQWVKDLVLPLLWQRFNSWLGNFTCHECREKNCPIWGLLLQQLGSRSWHFQGCDNYRQIGSPSQSLVVQALVTKSSVIPHIKKIVDSILWGKRWQLSKLNTDHVPKNITPRQTEPTATDEHTCWNGLAHLRHKTQFHPPGGRCQKQEKIKPCSLQKRDHKHRKLEKLRRQTNMF